MAGKSLRIVSVVILLLSQGSVANATHCRQFFQQVYAQPVYAQPVVYYQAGRDIEAEALAEKVARLVAPKLLAQLNAPQQYQQPMKGQQLQQQYNKSPIQNGYGKQLQPLQQPQQYPQASPTAMQAHCASCHSGAAPKKGLVYDGVTQLEPWQVTAALRDLSIDKMPKDHRISPEIKGQIMEELLGLERPNTVQQNTGIHLDVPNSSFAPAEFVSPLVPNNSDGELR